MSLDYKLLVIVWRARDLLLASKFDADIRWAYSENIFGGQKAVGLPRLCC